MPRPLALLAALSAATAVGAQTPPAPTVPLVKTLRIEWAWRGDSIEGDYTPHMTVTDVGPAGVSIVMDATKGSTRGKEEVIIDTRMLPSAMAAGHIYRQIWITTDPLVMQGTTSMVLSADVMHDIMTSGHAPLTVVDHVNMIGGEQLSGLISLVHALTSDSTATGTPYAGTMARVEAGTVPFAVLINDRHVTVPAIHIRGVLTHDGERYPSDMWVLADPAFPLVLAHIKPGSPTKGFDAGGRVVAINFPSADAPAQIERDLAAKRPVEIYDIYFDYNSATIKPESDSTLAMLGAIMHRHPDWKLRVVGHTDSIGGNGAGNRLLSEHRAAAVKGTLTARYGVAESRLDTGGAGDSQPLETNATLQGRARNRRVELTRE
jgi:outer membrane protein OmpA-like peptidoglycan-associated protein